MMPLQSFNIFFYFVITKDEADYDSKKKSKEVEEKLADKVLSFKAPLQQQQYLL